MQVCLNCEAKLIIEDGALRDDDFSDYGLRFGVDRIIAGIELLTDEL